MFHTKDTKQGHGDDGGNAPRSISRYSVELRAAWSGFNSRQMQKVVR
jgi:hypothetical protein